MSDPNARPTLDTDEGTWVTEEREPLLGLLAEGVCRLDADGVLVDVNDAFAEPLGYDRERLLGEEVTALVVDEDRPRLSTVLGWYDAPDAPDGVRFDAVRVRFETASGERLERELRLDAARPSAPGETVAVVRDPAEDDASSGGPDLSALVAALPGMAYRCRTTDGPPTFVGEGCRDVTGYDPSVLESGAVGWREDVVHPCDRDRVRAEVREGLLRHDRFSVEYRIRTADGGTRWVSEFGRTHREPSGERVAVDGLVRDITDRRQSAARGEHGCDRLATRDRLNRLVRGIDAAVIRRSTRCEIERVVCERLADSDAYAFAWIGAVDVRNGRVEVRAEAGDEDAIARRRPLGGDLDGDTTERAVHTGELRVSADGSTAAVPVHHAGTQYGVLTAYATREDAFDGEERSILDHLGERVGHAIAAVERKRALTNDEFVEVEFRHRSPFAAHDLPAGDGTIRFEQAVPLGDGRHLEYGTASPGMVDTLRAMPERMPDVEEVSVVGEDDRQVRFELRRSGAPLRSVVAAHGHRMKSSVIDGGEHRVVVHLSPGTEVRRVVETVREAYPGVEFVSQRQVSDQTRSPRRFRESVLESLTGRQRTVVESAYYAGFFEWPRETTGEDVADSLGIAASTFHQHLRKAEAAVLEKLLCEVAVSE